MALISMTGYGAGEASAGGIKVEAELSSVNRKQFDVRMSLPRALVSLESRMREVVHGAVARGHVTGVVRIRLSSSTRAKGVAVDSTLAAAYIRDLRKAACELGLKDDLTARSLTYLQDVIQHEDVLEDTERIWRLTRKALKAALEHLAEMRKTEGSALGKDLKRRLKALRNRVATVKKLAPGVAERYRASLRRRLKAADVDLAGMDERLLKELALFADRSDISEEIVRLESHFAHAAKLMRSAKPAGRGLDFLCQEMFREINTIGSKASDKAISRHVIEFKTELESMREQVQNVE